VGQGGGNTKENEHQTSDSKQLDAKDKLNINKLNFKFYD